MEPTRPPTRSADRPCCQPRRSKEPGRFRVVVNRKQTPLGKYKKQAAQLAIGKRLRFIRERGGQWANGETVEHSYTLTQDCTHHPAMTDVHPQVSDSDSVLPSQRPAHACAYEHADAQGCPYQRPAEDLVYFAGSHWCRFHLPYGDNGQLSLKGHWDATTIQEFNAAIMAMLNAARVSNTTADLAGVVFPGDISFRDFSGAGPLPDLLCHGAMFCGNVDFSGTGFSDRADFSAVNFQGHANFTACVFAHTANFSAAHFHAEASFRHARFEASLAFENTRLHGRASFDEAVFSAEATFSHTSFLRYVGFAGSVFMRETWFGYTEFCCFASFYATVFYADAHFTKARFEDRAEFSESCFNNAAIFVETTFFGSANFTRMRVNCKASFSQILFDQDADFLGAHFERDVRFNESTFRGQARFSEARFLRDAGFLKVDFQDNLDCSRTVFHGHASFADAEFRHADFGHAEFRNEAVFSGAPPRFRLQPLKDPVPTQARVNFNDARFNDRATFTHRRFSWPVHFDRTEFMHAPDFANCSFPERSSFRRCRLHDSGSRNAQAKWCYESLRQDMEAIGNRSAAVLFLRHERQASGKLVYAWPLQALLPTLAYVTSDHGQSASRPLCCLGITTVLAFVVYAYLVHGIVPQNLAHISWDTFLTIGKLALTPIVTPGWAYSSDCLFCGSLVTVVMTLQSILSVGWIGLALLALRHRRDTDKTIATMNV
jgi:uncharacterized protein YjbI with pentapeptide repeats